MAAPEEATPAPEGTEGPPAGPPPAGGADAANYVYWQQHGGEWADEYDQRKKWSVKYHAAELMLNEYVRNHAPLRVLEFGCGVGRHLRHLSQLPGVEAFGYDQSPTMVAQCLRWTGQRWLDEHVKVGAPTGRLPYDDGEFDLVYSSEVLVHVRPEDLDGILAELTRICRGHLLHLEPAPHTAICGAAHDGCWNHDLVAAFARLGRACEMLAAGYAEHAPYRVVIGAAPRYTWSPSLLALLRRMEEDLKPTLLGGFDAPLLRERLVHAETELHVAREQTRAAHHEYAVLFGKLEAVERDLATTREQAAAAEANDAALSATIDSLTRARDGLATRCLEAEAEVARRAARSTHLENENAQLTEALGREARERAEFIRRARELLDT